MSAGLPGIGHSVALVLVVALGATLAGACGAEAFHSTPILTPTDGGGGGGLPPTDTGVSFSDAVADAPREDLPVVPEVAAVPEVELLKADGVACGGASECRNGFCVDGVCCDSSCEGTCRSCARPGNAGSCGAIDVGTDPANECVDQGAATCGTDGACDGAGACRRYPTGTACAAPGCASSMLTLAGSCNAAGMCDRPAGASCGRYMCDGAACRTTCTADAHCTPPGVCDMNVCGGLVGTYYNTANFTGPIALTRTDPDIDFNWMAGSPAPDIQGDTFSVRWTGKITPRFTQTYTFYLLADDDMKLTINGMEVIDLLATNPDPTVEKQGTIALTANVPVSIQLDYVENTGVARIRLSWSATGEPKAVVPISALSPP